MMRQPGPFPWEEESSAAEPQPEPPRPHGDPLAPLDTDAAPDAAQEPEITADVTEAAILDDIAQSDDEPSAPEAVRTAPDPAGTSSSAAATPAEPAPAPPAASTAGSAQPHRPLVRKEYYAISEVSDLVGLPAHVLRYWESQFSVLNPSKNRSGNRVYQRKEIRLILLVKQLLYDEKYTVEGAKQRLDQLRRGGALQDATARALDEQLVGALRAELTTLAELLAPEED